jgi:hypothetical protein
MSSATDWHTHYDEVTDHAHGRRLATPMRLAAGIAAVLVVALLAAGCGSSNRSGSGRPATGKAATAGLNPALAYSRCMRDHGIPDFPDPAVTTSGRHRTVTIRVSSGSDFDPNDPKFVTADHACHALLGAGVLHTTPVSSRQLTGELKWSACMRSHGLPNFPDPDSQGAFDYAQIEAFVHQFTANSPLVVQAAKACKTYQPGSIHAIPGQP